MTWDPPGLWASIILSLSGGIVAGILVLLGEILIRMEYDRRQRMKAYKAMGLFFKEWETTISGAEAIPAQGPAPAVPKANVQFAFHGHFLRRAPNLIARWQRYLTAEQIEEVSNHLEGHQGAVIGILPQGAVLPQAQYENFFRQAREIKGVDF